MAQESSIITQFRAELLLLGYTTNNSSIPNENYVWDMVKGKAFVGYHTNKKLIGYIPGNAWIIEKDPYIFTTKFHMYLKREENNDTTKTS